MTDIESNPKISYSRVRTNDDINNNGTTSTTTSSSTNYNNTIPINPYSDISPRPKTIADRILGYAKRLFYITISGFILHHLKLYQAIFYSPNISHEWFKVGLASTIALLGIKAYVEIYEGRIHKAVVNYETFPQCTHATLVLLLLSSISYHIALWPHYRYNTFIVLNVLFFGIILQFILMTPSYIQNIVSFILLAFFLQEYQ